MNHKLSRGASIIVERWLQIREGESLFIVTNDNHLEEMKAVKHCAEEKGATVISKRNEMGESLFR